jgi:hypothetical protein
MRASSENFTKESRILKHDVKGFFMSINKQILFTQIQDLLSKERFSYRDDLLQLVHQIIFHDPTKHCRIKGSKADWI